MSFIDWSDPEALLTLLLEYVQDELGDSYGDAGRRRFLSALVQELSTLERRFPTLPDDERVESLREIIDSVDSAFRSDPVVEHLVHCAQELERIGREHAESRPSTKLSSATSVENSG
jgi:hypothetical protein